jgi:hypothetical protein
MSMFFTFAQTGAKQTFYLVNYYKADRGKSAEYISLIKTYASKIWKEKIKQGDVSSFTLYSVLTSSGNPNYDLVSIQSASSINDFSKTNTADFMKKAFPGMDEKTLTGMANMYGSLRVPVKTEIYTNVTALRGEGDYMEVNFMKSLPGKEGEYVRQEKEVYQPIHQEFIKNGNRTAWYFNRLIVPLAEGSEYNYVTGNLFKDWDKSYSVTVDEYMSTYKKLFPKTPLPDGARTMVRTDVWKVEVREKSN